MLVHASAVNWHGRGILIKGESGSGKSSLAIALLAQGAHLIADDQVQLHQEDGQLFASAPERLYGLIECRGAGIFHRETPASPSLLHLEISLVAQSPRLPEHPQKARYLEIELPRFSLVIPDWSLSAKVWLLCQSVSTATQKAEYHLHAPD
tara:strand:+ start:1967 stop:2419 length:453 start_codon:yes stop_codon:yes gene_type:complete